MGMANLARAVQSLDTFWYNDNERRPYEHTGANGRNQSELARR